MSMDLHLKYILTDSNGNLVYEKYWADDRMTLLKPMGNLTLTPELTTNIANEIQMDGVVGDEFRPVKHNLDYMLNDRERQSWVDYQQRTEEQQERAKQDVCWRNHENVVCKCKNCVGDL
jgi:hypothetical protein